MVLTFYINLFIKTCTFLHGERLLAEAPTAKVAQATDPATSEQPAMPPERAAAARATLLAQIAELTSHRDSGALDEAPCVTDHAPPAVAGAT